MRSTRFVRSGGAHERTSWVATAAAIAIKASIVLLIGLGVLRACRRVRASTRHLIVAATFGALLLLPLALALTPTTLRFDVPQADLAGGFIATMAMRSDTVFAVRTALAAVAPLTWDQQAQLVWAAGVLAILARFAAALRRLRRMRRCGIRWIAGSALARTLAAESESESESVSVSGLRWRRPVDVLLHEEITAPFTAGLWSPAIVLPSGARHWIDADLRRALLHELEHVRRCDWVVQLTARSVCAAYWFNPLVWIALRRLCLEAERACDDAVVVQGDAAEYAEQLVALAERVSRTAPQQPTLAMAGRSDLSVRVSAILDAGQRRGRTQFATTLITLAIALAALIAIAPLRASSGSTVCVPGQASGRTTPLTSGRRTARVPRWSPSGNRIAFLATVNGNPQILVLPTDGGEARRLTSGGWSIYVWDPAIDWNQDGTHIAFTTQVNAGTRAGHRRGVRVERIDGSGGDPIAGADTNFCNSLGYSPDGRWIGVTCPTEGQHKNQPELGVIPAAAGGGPIRWLSRTVDRNFTSARWTTDGTALVATAPDAGDTGLWIFPMAGEGQGQTRARRWTLGTVQSRGDLDVASDSRVVLVGTTSVRPDDLYIASAPDREPARLTDFHHEIAALTLGKTDTIYWKNDGFQLSGIVTYPPDFDATRKYPVVLQIHGGPWFPSRTMFMERAQILAAQGWIVFQPNYRGSDNYGNALYSAIYRDHGAGPGRDVMAGLDALKAREFVDTSRIGVSGWSYGGYMTTWLIGHYQGWKAALAGAAVIDLDDDYNLNDVNLQVRAYGETLSTPADLALMREQSPGPYVDAMTTPLLLVATTGDACASDAVLQAVSRAEGARSRRAAAAVSHFGARARGSRAGARRRSQVGGVVHRAPALISERRDAQRSQTHARSRFSGGICSSTSSGMRVEKHQQVSLPLATPQALLSPHRGHRVGSTGVRA